LFLTNWQDVIAAVVTAAVSDMRIREPAVGIPITPARNFSSFMASRNSAAKRKPTRPFGSRDQLRRQNSTPGPAGRRLLLTFREEL
jgi:hypothetical protein